MAGKVRREIETSSEGSESTEDVGVQDKDYPMVFYCNKCSAIIGDSIAWMCVNQGIQAIVLQRVTNKVRECDELFMSSSGPDKGSTYVELKCSECSENIGRMYKSTPPHLDEARDVYNLYAPKIDSYIIGSDQGGHVDMTNKDGSKISYCFSQIKKLQQIIIEYNSRMSAIEERLGIEKSLHNDAGGTTSDHEPHMTGYKSETSASSWSRHKENLNSAKRKRVESIKDERLLQKKNKCY